ncbi:hypothetical protein VOLCADRAFT_96154 [Volvox carteri f. nagariensis]|uniref:Uncharacterized protein n=1 Tax=Volvox carteri f. nagariensis TaxID=3068 RepID=D8U9C6_VOLCA|nr:uncharacterized protein VOLCADRAFT_96154 [Volvox carteri f. nagariensis]EFJ43781.1 hypothetical protein VOLCADRAFT_96154 [Volvox carteri f. nagariensis]|eukprot:XP_002955262.1 hypothetical protein VOLCADRAFT_96154 [Volvox carteri f. nagariensis]
MSPGLDSVFTPTLHPAEVLLGASASAAGGNPWWLYLEPAFIRANPGYEVLIGMFFLGCLPFTIALNSLAFTIAALACAPREGRLGGEAGAAAAPESASTSSRTHGSLSSSPSSPWPLGSTSPGAAVRNGDDTGAAALADLGIHALPTAPPPAASASASRHAADGAVTSAPNARNSDVAHSPLLDEPPVTVSAISAATSLAAAPPPSPPAALLDADPRLTTAGSLLGVLPEAGRAFRRVWLVDLQFNMRALPLQGLCLLVLPAVWALPRLMRIQLALPAAVLEGQAGRDALNRSSSLMTSSLAAYGMPFAAVLAAGRLLEYIQGVVLVLIPPRWWREVVEVPLLIAGAFLLLKAAVHRLQDLLPLAAYLELTQQEQEAARKLQQQQVVLMRLDEQHAQQQQQQQDPRHGAAKQAQQHALGAAGSGAQQPGAPGAPVAVAGT